MYYRVACSTREAIYQAGMSQPKGEIGTAGSKLVTLSTNTIMNDLGGSRSLDNPVTSPF